jgi:chloramphenicol O-acetyltransferase type A
MGRYLDLQEWKRREHYALFRSMPNPWFSICLDVDVSHLWHSTREPGGPSFFLAALFVAMRAVNLTEAFRLRLREDGVWLHDQVDASSTIMRADETFVFAQFRTFERFDQFQAHGLDEIARARAAALGGQSVRDDLIYHSTLPWIRFTAFTNPLSTADDSIPRIVFGKCFQTGGAWHMPVAIEVHHALVDGLDVARFVERFQEGLDAPLPGHGDAAPEPLGTST